MSPVDGKALNEAERLIYAAAFAANAAERQFYTNDDLDNLEEARTIHEHAQDAVRFFRIAMQDQET